MHYSKEFGEYCNKNNIERTPELFDMWQAAQSSIHAWYSWQSGDPLFNQNQLLIELDSGDFVVGFWAKWKNHQDRILRWRYI